MQLPLRIIRRISHLEITISPRFDSTNVRGAQSSTSWLQLTKTDGDPGLEHYSASYVLSDECRYKLLDYDGFVVDQDTRSPEKRKGCGYAFSNDDCTGSIVHFNLGLNGQSLYSSFKSLY